MFKNIKLVGFRRRDLEGVAVCKNIGNIYIFYNCSVFSYAGHML